MALPCVSRFQSAALNALPDYVFEAPVIANDDQHNFSELLQAFADDRSQSDINHYFSLSKWNGGHSQADHVGSTCAHLAYTKATAPHVSMILKDGKTAFYSFPIKDGRRYATMFALPLADLLKFDETIRFANMMASMIDVKGILPNSYLPTYFFHFRKDAQIEFHPGAQFGRDLIEEFNGKTIYMKRWLS